MTERRHLVLSDQLHEADLLADLRVDPARRSYGAYARHVEHVTSHASNFLGSPFVVEPTCKSASKSASSNYTLKLLLKTYDVQCNSCPQMRELNLWLAELF